MYGTPKLIYHENSLTWFPKFYIIKVLYLMIVYLYNDYAWQNSDCHIFKNYIHPRQGNVQ